MTVELQRKDHSYQGRVLYVARAPFVTGAERALLTMLRHLDRSHVRPHVVLGERTDLVRIIEAMDIPVTVMAMPRRSEGSVFSWWRSVAQMNALVHRFKPDLLHANDVFSCQQMSVAGAQNHVPRFIHVRSGVTAGALAGLAPRGAESLICISDWVAGQLGPFEDTPFAGAHVEQLVDAVDWPGQTQEKPPPRNPGGGGSPCIGFAGQLMEDKGLDLVIRALREMEPADRPRLLVAGVDRETDGAYQRMLERLAADCGVADRITWLGFLDNPDDLYTQVDAMVCPSRVEALGLVPLEAARFAIPTFATRTGGFRQTIEHNVNGVLVKAEPQSWAIALRQVQIGPWLRQMGEAAWERTRRLHAPSTYQQRLMQLYAQLAARRSGRASA